MSRIPFWQTATIILVAMFLATGGWYYYQTSNRITWSMIDIGGEPDFGDAHLLEFPDGHVVLIDTGFDSVTRREVIPFLDQRGIKHINQLIITNAQPHYYGGIESLLGHLKRIDNVYFNIPTETECRRLNQTSDCEYERLARIGSLIESSGTVLRGFETDELFYNNDEHDVYLEAVYVHDNERSSGESSGAGTGALLRLVYGTTTVLFTGDVSRRVGEQLVEDHFFLESVIMTAPNPVPNDSGSDTFLNAVGARAIMASKSLESWRGRSSERVRRFAYDNDVPAYVTGLHGNVTVTLERDGFSVDTEHEHASLN